MTQACLGVSETVALRGAEALDDSALDDMLADCIDRAVAAADDHTRIQDLRELAVVALVLARRLERRR